ncbi:acyl-CoA dehydrogenase family protein [Streptomyces sp. NPDC001415]
MNRSDRPVRTVSGPRWGLSRHTRTAPPHVSRERADTQIAWLRQYAPRRLNSRVIDERRCIPPYIVQDFGRAGLFGPLIEEDYGGTALTFTDMFRVSEQLAAIDTGLATWMGTSLFPGTRALSVWATEPVKQEWLPLLATGRTLGSYAQTEPAVGSDFSRVTTTATRQDGGWLLTGDKHWIGNGAWAGICTVIAQRADPARPAGSPLLALAVPTDSPGVVLGEEHLSFGQRGMVQNRMYFDHVSVPDTAVLGQGNARNVAMDSMNASRLALAAAALGALKRLVQLGVRFAERRTVSGLPLKDRTVVRTRLNETVARTDILHALVYDLAERLDGGQTVAMEPIIAVKVFASEWAVHAADTLMQLLGSRGYDEANPAARMYRDLRVFRIFEGANEALEDFLGRRSLRQTPYVTAVLHDLCGPDLASRFSCSVYDLPDHATGPADATHAPLARAAMWTIASGIVHQRIPANAHACHHASHNLARALDHVHDAASGPETAQWDHVEEAAHLYQDGIGDIEQHLPGLGTRTDSLLETRP